MTHPKGTRPNFFRNNLSVSRIGQNITLVLDLVGGGVADGQFPVATSLGFAGFLFSLLKPMLGMGGNDRLVRITNESFSMRLLNASRHIPKILGNPTLSLQ